MRVQSLDGYMLKNLFNSGMMEVNKFRQHINEINVFPVADGDTGTNMTITLRAMVEKSATSQSFCDTVKNISESGLAHARGNSGIILATYVSGLAEEGKLYETVTIKEFAQIAHRAVDHIYEAIENPVEGTMISVIRDWAEFMSNSWNKYAFFDEMLIEAYAFAEISLKRTTNMIEVLKKNNVVDSGAEGFVRFLEGINKFFGHNIQFVDKFFKKTLTEEVDEPINYRFCIELYLDSVSEDRNVISGLLKSFGDSLIISKNGKSLRVHIHSDFPSLVVDQVEKFGVLEEQKVDDMILQNSIKSKKKNKIALVTDSIADIPDKYKLDNQIVTIPMGLIMKDTIYLDKLTITSEKVFEAMESQGINPTSSLPEMGRVKAVLEELSELYESIIVVSVSGKLSGTYNVFMKSADELRKNGFKISVIDSRLNSGAQGLLVKRINEAIIDGLNHDEIMSYAEEVISKTKIFVCLDTVEYAVKSGRVQKTIGSILMKIGARPIMTLDAQGKGAAFGIAFSKASITRKIMNLIDNTNKKNKIISYSIVHCENPNLAKKYKEALIKNIGIEPEFVTEISSVTAIHSGIGSVAVSFIES